MLGGADPVAWQRDAATSAGSAVGGVQLPGLAQYDDLPATGGAQQQCRAAIYRAQRSCA